MIRWGGGNSGHWALVVLAGALAVGCGHVTHVRPTPVHALDVEAELGGPLALLGSIPIGLPLATVGASYGLEERLDVQAHLHVTPLFFGVAGFDVGASYLALLESGSVPAVSVATRLYGFSDIACQSPSDACGTETNHGARAYAEVTAAGSYLLGGRYLTYLGVSTLLQFDGGPPLLSVQLGTQIQFTRLALQVEFRWFEPNYNTTRTVVNWLSIGGQGAWGFVLGGRYRLGGLL